MSDANENTSGTGAMSRTQTESMRGTTVNITVEVEDDGNLTKEERQKLTDLVIEEGMNSEDSEWDGDFSAPTRGNRSV
jgi:hypothetical protein